MRKILFLSIVFLMGIHSFAMADYTEWRYIGKYTSEDACQQSCVDQMPTEMENPFEYFTGEVAYTKKFFGKFKGWCYCEMYVVHEGGSDGE